MKFNRVQIGSFFLSLLIYSIFFNIKLGFVITFGLLFHELGHIWAAKYSKLQTDGIYFIPFFGAVAIIKDNCKTFKQQAFVSIMGPVWGGLSAVICFLLFLITKQTILLQISSWLCFFNVLNLLPLSFLDGGWLLGSLTYSYSRKIGLIFKIISQIVGAIIFTFMFNPMIGLVFTALGIQTIIKEIKNYWYYHQDKYHLLPDSYLFLPESLNRREKFQVFFGWVFTGSVLWLLYMLTQTFPDGSFRNLL